MIRPDLALAVVAASLVMVLATATTGARAQTIGPAWTSTPYEVHLVLWIERQPLLTPDWQDDFSADLLAQAERVVGRGWNLQIFARPAGDNPWDTLSRLAGDELHRAADTLLVMRVSSGPADCQVEVRSWDVASGTLGPSVTRRTPRREALSAEAFRALLSAFAPLARVESVRGNQVIMVPRAADLAPRDETLRWHHPGAVYRVTLQSLDRNGVPQSRQSVDWTYLVAEEKLPQRLVCRLETGLRASLGNRRGRRIWIASAITPTHDATQLTLVDQQQSDRPLAGYQVWAAEADGGPHTLVGISDLRGQVLVAAAAEPLRRLYVTRGGETLARVPVVPGWTPALELRLPADDLRLEARGVLLGVQEHFVDLIAQRRILSARVEALLESGRAAEACAVFDQLRGLPSTTSLVQAIREQQARLRAGNPLQQAELDRLFADTLLAVSQFDDPRLVERLAEKLRAAPE